MNQELKDKIIAALKAEPHSLGHFSDEIVEKIEAVLDAGRPALPTIHTYGHYSSDNYGASTLAVQIGDIVLYYSYHTIVAYRDWKDGLVVSVNNWSTTTGKHLNWINPDHSRRVKNFDEKLSAALLRHGIKED